MRLYDGSVLSWPSAACLQEGTTAALLQQKPRGSREAVQIQMQLGRRVALEGEELRAWQEARRGQQMEGPPVVQAAITDADIEAAPDLHLPQAQYVSLGSF